MKLSIVIPAHNEEDCIGQVITGILEELEKENIDNEVLVVNDNSTDKTKNIIEPLLKEYPTLKLINRKPPAGFGRAVREGLEYVTGDAIAIVMGDASDESGDIVRCFRKIEEGYDCVFGSRFMRGSVIKDYPLLKLIINRLANTFIRLLFMINANDITNAFKVYRNEVIKGVQPLQATHFNITVEIPLKAIVRGFSFTQIPINWYGRKSGVSKLSIRYMGRKYIFTVLYVWLENILIKDEIKNRVGA